MAGEKTLTTLQRIIDLIHSHPRVSQICGRSSAVGVSRHRPAQHVHGGLRLPETTVRKTLVNQRHVIDEIRSGNLLQYPSRKLELLQATEHASLIGQQKRVIRRNRQGRVTRRQSFITLTGIHQRISEITAHLEIVALQVKTTSVHANRFLKMAATME
jgi:hypothetical protein